MSSETERKKQKLAEGVFYAYYQKENDEKIKKAFENIKKHVGSEATTKKAPADDKMKKLWKEKNIAKEEPLFYRDDTKIGFYPELETFLKAYKDKDNSKPKTEEKSTVSSSDKSTEKTKAKSKGSNKRQPEPVVSLTDFLKTMTLAQLKLLAKKYKIDTNQKKQELIDRLEENDCPLDLKSLKNDQIRKLLKEHHLDTTGNKTQMVERLLNPEKEYLEKDLDDLPIDKLKAMLKDRGLPTVFEGLAKMVKD
eukprot:TRINITY_DN983_c0_g1_i2.p1 TRINITY_DN983_c0_g1~~TRINITY_DN983_c0_g1_i2.p1  ORF type:complete len:251 (+),score=79.03 TRINITY_DN983_c0_g1_i2:123-875(+)